MQIHDRVDAGTGYIHTIEEAIANVHDSQPVKVDFRICKHPSTPTFYSRINWEKKIEYYIASVRYKVEHTFLIVKRDFDYRKVVYRRIA